MYQTRLLCKEDIMKYQDSLTGYLYTCLAENIEGVCFETAQMYYENMKKYICDGSAIIVGVFDNNNLIAFQWVYEIVYIGKKRFHSTFVFVDPEYRGKKIGNLMMREMERIAKDCNIDAIEAMCTVANENSVQYHLHNGFKVERYNVVKKLNEDSRV